MILSGGFILVTESWMIPPRVARHMFDTIFTWSVDYNSQWLWLFAMLAKLLISFHILSGKRGLLLFNGTLWLIIATFPILDWEFVIFKCLVIHLGIWLVSRIRILVVERTLEREEYEREKERVTGRKLVSNFWMLPVPPINVVSWASLHAPLQGRDEPASPLRWSSCQRPPPASSPASRWLAKYISQLKKVLTCRSLELSLLLISFGRKYIVKATNAINIQISWIPCNQYHIK